MNPCNNILTVFGSLVVLQILMCCNNNTTILTTTLLYSHRKVITNQLAFPCTNNAVLTVQQYRVQSFYFSRIEGPTVLDIAIERKISQSGFGVLNHARKSHATALTSHTYWCYRTLHHII